MLDYIALYPNEHESELNMDFLSSAYDKPLDYYVIACMKDLECIENIDIESYKIIEDQDEVDINRHMININYKKKDMNSIEIPKNIYMLDSRFHEIEFHVRVHTNLHEKRFIKRILVPTEHDGYYLINGKKMTAIWQMVDASTYSRRGQITMKSRMPIMIYCNKNRVITDINGENYSVPTYSYAQDSTKKNRYKKVTAKKNIKFINPLLLFMAKMGLTKTLKFWGMQDIIKVKRNYTKADEKKCRIFAVDECYLTVTKEIFDEIEMVRSFVGMFIGLENRDFPVEIENMEDTGYWICRIGYIGSVKNTRLLSFLEKGRTSIHMIERLLDFFTVESLRLPDIYKSNIYQVMYWMITNFDKLKQRVNIDMKNKRIRKNEVIVSSTLGRKTSENVTKLIERKTKSKMNNMDTILEIFNFNSDIIMSGMRNMNDIVKGDDASNDMAFINKWAYTCKGPQSLGEGSSKIIADKYRYLHPSMVGVVDLFTTSNNDVGMSGSIVPFVKLYDGFFFTPEHEPCDARYKFEKTLRDLFCIDRKIPLDTFDDYIEYQTKKNAFARDLKYEPIEIIERDVTTLESQKETQHED